MPQHMGVRLEREGGLLAGSLDHPAEAVAIKRCAALTDEHESRFWGLLLLQPPKRSRPR
jgi:hypothetical protein